MLMAAGDATTVKVVPSRLYHDALCALAGQFDSLGNHTGLHGSGAPTRRRAQAGHFFATTKPSVPIQADPDSQENLLYLSNTDSKKIGPSNVRNPVLTRSLWNSAHRWILVCNAKFGAERRNLNSA